jgi:hypothetical protein
LDLDVVSLVIEGDKAADDTLEDRTKKERQEEGKVHDVSTNGRWQEDEGQAIPVHAGKRYEAAQSISAKHAKQGKSVLSAEPPTLSAKLPVHLIHSSTPHHCTEQLCLDAGWALGKHVGSGFEDVCTNPAVARWNQVINGSIL